MYFIVTVLLVCAAASAAPSLEEKPQNKIVGGHSVDIREYKHQVALFYAGQFFCGGSIISKKFVVTAAHCAKDTDHPELTTVRAGSSYFSGFDGVTKSVLEIYKNINFTASGSFVTESDITYDIALLELTEEFEFSDTIGAVKLPERGTLPAPYQSGRVSGWGSIVSSIVRVTPYQLQAINVRVYDIIRSPTATFIRIIAQGKRQGLCVGDSGGGFTINGILHGINSAVEKECASGYPDSLASVGYLRDFITKIAHL